MADPNGFAGNVVSGSGSTYSVTLISVGGTVSVTVLGLDAAETLDVGTGLIIVKIGSTYYSTVAMWVD